MTQKRQRKNKGSHGNRSVCIGFSSFCFLFSRMCANPLLPQDGEGKKAAPMEVFNSPSSLAKDPALRRQQLDHLMDQITGSFSFIQVQITTASLSIFLLIFTVSSWRIKADLKFVISASALYRWLWKCFVWFVSCENVYTPTKVMGNGIMYILRVAVVAIKKKNPIHNQTSKGCLDFWSGLSAGWRSRGLSQSNQSAVSVSGFSSG